MLFMAPNALRAVPKLWAECWLLLAKFGDALLSAATATVCWAVGMERLMRLMLLVVQVLWLAQAQRLCTKVQSIACARLFA